MSTVYVSNAEMAYEMTQVIGVFDTLDEAAQRCKDRPYADEDEDLTYDRWWVEEWEVGGSFLRQFDLIDGEVVEQSG